MNYSNIKNHDINRRVAIALGCHVRKSAFDTNYYFTDDDKPWNKCAPHGPVEDFRPCEDWADAGPIIQEYGIELGYDGITWQASSSLHGIAPYDDWKNYPESPCRLAMIVFLMMQEGK